MRLSHMCFNYFSKMTNLGKNTQNVLAENFQISSLVLAEKLFSRDGSIKYRLLLSDGKSIESVFMRHKNHNTLCISSQVGCAMGCDFCMTGTMGLFRNLKTAEIIDQVLMVSNDLPEGEKIRNIVFMGMGEPFHNY